jgi:polyvinyl alcohol dehydrogenase (cytochrome)
VLGSGLSLTFAKAGVFMKLQSSRFILLPAALICAALPCFAQVSHPGKSSSTDNPNTPQSKSRVGFCSSSPMKFALDPEAPQWNGWGASISNKRFQSSSTAGISQANVPRLKPKWAFGFDGAVAAYGQPMVLSGNLFVGSEKGQIFSLDARSGCIHWSFQAAAGVRTAIIAGPESETNSASLAIYFGDQHGAVYALDLASGHMLWKAQTDSHPATLITGSPQLWKGRLYVPVASSEEDFAPNSRYECCSFRGSLIALDASSGRQIWKTYTINEMPHKTQLNSADTQLWGPSGAGVWSAPTLDPDHNMIYIATGNAYSDPAPATSDSVLALDLTSGKLLWSRQLTENDAYNSACYQADQSNCPKSRGKDFDFGSSPILVSLTGGHRELIAPQKSGVVYALDPDQEGKLLWQMRLGDGGPLGGVEWGAAADTDAQILYAALSDCNWKPIEWMEDGVKKSGYGLDPAKGGGMFALRLADGQQVWHASPSATSCQDRSMCSPAQLAAVSAIPGAVFSGALDGHLRAYSAANGRILWDFDTAQDFTTVNGVAARGGSINGPGPVIVGGMLFMNSGYGRFGEAAGNVLIAFSVEGK